MFKPLSEPHGYNNIEVYIKSSSNLHNEDGNSKENLPIRK